MTSQPGKVTLVEPEGMPGVPLRRDTMADAPRHRRTSMAEMPRRETALAQRLGETPKSNWAQAPDNKAPAPAPGKADPPSSRQAEENFEKGWNFCWQTMEKHDNKLIRGWKEELNNVLIFAGLFSAVVTGFLIAVFTWLQQPPDDLTTEVLAQISIQLASFTINSAYLNSTAPPYSSTSNAGGYSPSATVIAMNILWFASLALSLMAAVGAILVQQWLRQYLDFPLVTMDERASIRQSRHDALLNWSVPEIISTLSVALQIALVFFLVGLIALVWILDKVVAISITSMLAILFLALAVVTILPYWRYDCPYRSPSAWIVHLILSRLQWALVLPTRLGVSGLRSLLHFVRDRLLWACMQITRLHPSNMLSPLWRDWRWVLRRVRNTVKGWQDRASKRLSWRDWSAYEEYNLDIALSHRLQAVSWTLQTVRTIDDRNVVLFAECLGGQHLFNGFVQWVMNSSVEKSGMDRQEELSVPPGGPQLLEGLKASHILRTFASWICKEYCHRLLRYEATQAPSTVQSWNTWGHYGATTERGGCRCEQCVRNNFKVERYPAFTVLEFMWFWKYANLHLPAQEKAIFTYHMIEHWSVDQPDCISDKLHAMRLSYALLDLYGEAVDKLNMLASAQSAVLAPHQTYMNGIPIMKDWYNDIVLPWMADLLLPSGHPEIYDDERHEDWYLVQAFDYALLAYYAAMIQSAHTLSLDQVKEKFGDLRMCNQYSAILTNCPNYPRTALVSDRETLDALLRSLGGKDRSPQMQFVYEEYTRFLDSVFDVMFRLEYWPATEAWIDTREKMEEWLNSSDGWCPHLHKYITQHQPPFEGIPPEILAHQEYDADDRNDGPSSHPAATTPDEHDADGGKVEPGDPGLSPRHGSKQLTRYQTARDTINSDPGPENREQTESNEKHESGSTAAEVISSSDKNGVEHEKEAEDDGAERQTISDGRQQFSAQELFFARSVRCESPEEEKNDQVTREREAEEFSPQAWRMRGAIKVQAEETGLMASSGS